MIHINRDPIVPKAFSSDAILSDIRKYEEFYSRPAPSRSQEAFSASVYGDTRDTLEAISVAFKYKCAACERKLKYLEVVSDSWRPRHNAKGLDSEFSAEHYWWLSYDWNNKYALCTKCNNYKGTWFPVDGNRAPLRTGYMEILKIEDALLIDPCHDYPEEHFYVSPKDGYLYPLSKKGEVTIEILKLNRNDTVSDRKFTIKEIADHIKALNKIWVNASPKPTHVGKSSSKELITKLRKMRRVFALHPQREYVLVWRQILLNWLKENPSFSDSDAFTSAFSSSLNPEELKDCLEAIRIFHSLFESPRKEILGFNVEIICAPVSGYLQKIPPNAISKSISFDSGRKVTEKKAKSDTKPSRSASQSPETLTWTDNVSQNTGLVRLYPEKIEVSNFKSISHLSFSFKIPVASQNTFGLSSTVAKEPWKFLLGENGVGKSSILQAISLVLCGQTYIKSLDIDPAELLKHGTKEGFVKIWFVGTPDPATLQFNKQSLSCNFPSGRMNVLGYGSTRLMPKKNTTLQPEVTHYPVKVKNLFDYSVSLSDPDYWLLNIDLETFDHVSKALKDVLDLPSVETYFIRTNDKIYFSRQQETLNQLSEGYRSVIGLAIDIMKSLSEASNSKNASGKLSYEVIEGIVLIDEISSHLHPRWQMKIVKAFRKAFPKLQFIVTSHDPLSLKGVESGEVLLLKRNELGEVISIENLPDPSSLRAEQLLTSEFFGLNSTLDPDLEILFNTYHTLLTKEQRTPAEEEMLANLRNELKDKNHLGNTLREELMYEVIDQSVANYTMGRVQQDRKELFKTTKDKVFSIWENLYNKKE